MTDPNTTPAPESQTGSADSQGRKSRRRWLVGGLLAGGLLGSLATLSAGAWSGMGGPDGMRHAGFGHCGGWMGRGHGGPEAMKERAEFAADWALTRVGATEEQRSRIQAIISSAMDDLADARLKHRGHRAEFVDALQQPALDRAKLESLRRAELELAEAASSRMVQAIAEAAEVLTPEQRAQLAERLMRWRRGV